ncbi:MAG: hypothetical protein ACXWUN_06430 [Allosphingosinicella sp.]
MDDARLPSGEPRYPNLTRTGLGRPKGSLNKTTVAIKEAIMAVYQDLQDGAGGGHAHFRKWATEHPGDFYKMFVKLLPLQVKTEVEGGLVAAVVFKGINDRPD